MRKRIISLVAIFAALLIVGCSMPQTPVVVESPTATAPGETATPAASPSGSATPVPTVGQAPGTLSALSLQPQKLDGYTASLAIDPYPPAINAPAVLKLNLQDGAGKPVTDAKVTFDLTMPDMHMPPNKPAATEKSDGLYLAEAVFTMTGAWQIAADVTTGSESRQFTFAIELK